MSFVMASKKERRASSGTPPWPQSYKPLEHARQCLAARLTACCTSSMEGDSRTSPDCSRTSTSKNGRCTWLPPLECDDDDPDPDDDARRASVMVDTRFLSAFRLDLTLFSSAV